MVKHNDSNADLSPSKTLPGGYRRMLAVIATGLLALAACGSSDDKAADGVASVNDVNGNAAGADDTAVETDPDDIWAEYEQCLKDEGVDTDVIMGDMEEGGNEVGGEVSTGNSIPDDFDWEGLEAASEICDPILEDFDPYAGMSPEERAAVDDYMADLENCLKDKGFDIPMGDPTGGNTVGDADATDYTFPDDIDYDELEQAYNECDEEVELPQALKDLEAASTTAP